MALLVVVLDIFYLFLGTLAVVVDGTSTTILLFTPFWPITTNAKNGKSVRFKISSVSYLKKAPKMMMYLPNLQSIKIYIWFIMERKKIVKCSNATKVWSCVKQLKIRIWPSYQWVNCGNMIQLTDIRAGRRMDFQFILVVSSWNCADVDNWLFC